MKRIISLMLALLLSVTSVAGLAAANTASKETVIKLTDTSVTVDGQVASKDAASAVYTGASIVYYEVGRGSSYGEGEASDAHSAEEAAKHTIVTITKPGVYRVSGKLSAGQLAIDLGAEASTDPTAVVTLILDGVHITNTVAPGVIFYNVYEPYSSATDTNGVIDLSSAGAQVVLADDSVNTVNGSYVARIYKPGTTKKLHKYDGAFYSKMSLNISGESKGTGELHVTGANEGLDSELHLALNGGKVYIQSQDDGVNTNEDRISVTSINGGYLYVNAGLGAEGDGIDSNGYLTINGGTIVTMANERSPDGGIDADMSITINGGTVVALGTRNDATSSASKQPYIELSLASRQSAGTTLTLTDASGNPLLSHTAEKAFQSVTFSSPRLKLNTEYQLYLNDKLQQYTGNSFGRGGGFGGNRPSGGGQFGQGTASTGGSTAFVITPTVHSFSGISEALGASSKARVTFTVNQGAGIQSVASGENITFDSVTASATVPDRDIQLTVTDLPSENYSETFLLSELKGDLTRIMPKAEGQYRLTVAVVSSSTAYTGVSEWQFAIGGLPFNDVNVDDLSYEAIKLLFEQGIMIGTSPTEFSPNASITRASAITTLGRLLKVEPSETSVFSDVVSNSWYSGYVGWAAGNGLVLGDGKGSFMPDASLTVEQMKLVISRYIALAGLKVSVDDLFPSSLTGTMSRAELAVLLSKLR